MISFSFILLWLGIDIALIDLLDTRYRDTRTIKLIPSVDILWQKIVNSYVVSFCFSWLYLELSVTFYDVEHFIDSFEQLLKEKEQAEK